MKFLFDIEISQEKREVINKFLEVDSNKKPREVRSKEFEVIEKELLPKGISMVLDLGCGNGLHSIYLSKIYENVFSVDRDVKDSVTHSISLDSLRKICKSLNISNIKVLDGIAENIPIEDSSVDLVYSHFVFEHVINKNSAIKEINRVMKDNGYMIMTVPTLRNRIEWGLKYYFTKQFIYGLVFPYRLFVKKQTLKESFRDFHIFIQPHDRRYTFLQECIMYKKGNWVNLIKNNGHEIVKSIEIRNDSITFLSRKRELK